jgi:hypothetical protein
LRIADFSSISKRNSIVDSGAISNSQCAIRNPQFFSAVSPVSEAAGPVAKQEMQTCGATRNAAKVH